MSLSVEVSHDVRKGADMHKFSRKTMFVVLALVGLIPASGRADF